jgi:hypothetical protein
MEFCFNANITTMSEVLRSAVNESNFNRHIISTENDRFISLLPYHYGVKVITPYISASQESVDTIYNFVNFINSSFRDIRIINRNCSLHLNFDIINFNFVQVRNFMKVMYCFEESLLKITPYSRRNNSSCFPIRSNIIKEKINTMDIDLDIINRNLSCPIFDIACGVSLNKFPSKSVVSIRYAAGTSSPKKATYWLKLMLILLNISKNMNFEINMDNDYSSIDSLKSFILENNTCEQWLEETKSQICEWIDIRNQQLNVS